MSQTQTRLDIMQHVAAAAFADRAERLLERIKLESHWQLITTPARSFPIDESTYAADRASLVANWPDIRHRRVAVGAMFYDLVNDHASLLTHLIEIRRQRRNAGNTQ